MPLAPPPQRARVAQHLDPGERLAEPHDHARHAAVAHDQVGAEPERHDRRAFVELRHEMGAGRRCPPARTASRPGRRS